MLTVKELRTNRFFMVFLACLVAMGPIAIDAYLPMMPNIADYFDTNISAVNLTMSTFLIGNAIGQFFGGALSDQLGRKKIGLIGIALFFISSIIIVQADTIIHVQLYRVTQAIGSGFASVICLAQIKDLYPKEEVMKRFADVMMVVLLAPLLAPVLGATMVQYGWQSIFILLSAWSFILFFIYLFRIPETNKQTIQTQINRFSFHELFKGYRNVITHKMDGQMTPIRFMLFTGFSSAVFMTFLTNSSLIYMHHFKLSEYQFSAVFAAHGVMLMIGNRTAVKLSNSLPAMQILTVVNLLQLTVTAFLCLTALIDMEVLILILSLSLITMAANGAIAPTASGIFINHFDKNAGSAASLNTTIIFFIGAIIGAIAATLSKGNLLPIFLIMAMSSLLAKELLRSMQSSIQIKKPSNLR